MQVHLLFKQLRCYSTWGNETCVALGLKRVKTFALHLVPVCTSYKIGLHIIKVLFVLQNVLFVWFVCK